MDPQKMFSQERVVDLQGETKEEVLKELVEAVATSPDVTDGQDLFQKIMEREKTLSTGIGVGLALPHVKIPTVRDFVIGIGRKLNGVEFDAIDGGPVHIIVMIACNDSQSGDYMKVLSKLVRFLKERDFQDKVMNARRPQEIVDLFTCAAGPFPCQNG